MEKHKPDNLSLMLISNIMEKKQQVPQIVL